MLYLSVIGIRIYILQVTQVSEAVAMKKKPYILFYEVISSNYSDDASNIQKPGQQDKGSNSQVRQMRKCRKCTTSNIQNRKCLQLKTTKKSQSTRDIEEGLMSHLIQASTQPPGYSVTDDAEVQSLLIQLETSTPHTTKAVGQQTRVKGPPLSGVLSAIGYLLHRDTLHALYVHTAMTDTVVTAIKSKQDNDTVATITLEMTSLEKPRASTTKKLTLSKAGLLSLCRFEPSGTAVHNLWLTDEVCTTTLQLCNTTSTGVSCLVCAGDSVICRFDSSVCEGWLTLLHMCSHGTIQLSVKHSSTYNRNC